MLKDNFDKQMIEAGVTETDLMTKAYGRIKKAVENNPDIFIGGGLGDAMEEAARLTKALNGCCSGARPLYIDDKNIRNAISAYTTTLDITKKMFGEGNMTENVICKAIEAASYIAYRSIMGEAAPVGKRY